MRFRSLLVFAGFALIVGWILAGILAVSGCAPLVAEKVIARAAVLSAAEAVRASDVECARLVRATGDRALGEKCDATYTAARASLIVAGTAVDTWENVGSRKSVTCALINSTRELALLEIEIVGKGGKALRVIDDARAIASKLGACP